jgi:hypothetical protein
MLEHFLHLVRKSVQLLVANRTDYMEVDCENAS